MTIADLMIEPPDPTHGFPQPSIPESGWRHVLELADPTADPLVWHDLTAYYAGDRYGRGADEYQGRYRAAVAEVTLVAGDDRLAPWNPDTSIVFGTHIEIDVGLLMRMLFARVVGGNVVEWLPIWAGRVDDWGDVSLARGRVRIHRVTVLDTMSDLVNRRVPATSQENWPDRIDTLLTTANWLFGHDTYGVFEKGILAALELPARDAQTSAIAELDRTCDPADVVWRSRRNGRLVFHPAPGSTFHDLDESANDGEAWENPLLDEYPDGLVFSWNPDVGAGEIAYAQYDDRVEPFGIPKTRAAVRNNVVVTHPDGVDAADDPVSASRYGAIDESLEWIARNDEAAERLLAARAYATPQATPLTTSIDMQGFWPAMAMVDHFDPVTIVHANRDDGPVATAVGRIRSVVEERSLRPGRVSVGGETTAFLDWVSTVQADIDAVAAEAALLPVEDLRPGGPGGVTFVEWEWDLPVQPSVSPTHVQVRMLGVSDYWWDVPYPATYFKWGALEPATFYTFEVRLIRRVNGLITHASAVRSRTFSTGEWPLPEPPHEGDDGDTTVPLPEIDPECDVEWELQETEDSETWTTIATGDQDHEWMEPDPGGGYFLNVPASEFDDGKLYRVRQREVCGGMPGPWFTGYPFDPPDDWEDPCTTPPRLSEPPFDDESLVMFIPKICAPDIITEAVTGFPWVKGPAFGELRAQFADGDDIALATTSEAGVVTGGAAAGLHGLHEGDASLHWRGQLGEATTVTLVNAGFSIQLVAVPDGDGWKALAVANNPVSPLTVESEELDLHTAYELLVTWEHDTGTLRLYVDDEEVDDATFGVEVPLNTTLPIGSMELPAGSWCTDIAVWSSLAPAPAPVPSLPDAIMALGPVGYWKLDDGTESGDPAADSSGNDRHGQYAGGVTPQAVAGPDGNDYVAIAGGTGTGHILVADHDDWTIGNDGMTIICLLRNPTHTANTRYIAVKSNANQQEWGWWHHSSQGVRCELWTNNGTMIARRTVSFAASGGWDMWVLVIPGPVSTSTSPKIYRNGATELAGTTTDGTGSYTNRTGPLRIGGVSTTSGSVAAGMAHTAIFQRALTDGEIGDLMAAAEQEGWITRED